MDSEWRGILEDFLEEATCQMNQRQHSEKRVLWQKPPLKDPRESQQKGLNWTDRKSKVTHSTWIEGKRGISCPQFQWQGKSFPVQKRGCGEGGWLEGKAGLGCSCLRVRVWMLTIFGVLCDLHGVLTRKTGQCFRPSRGLKSSPSTVLDTGTPVQRMDCWGPHTPGGAPWPPGAHTVEGRDRR